MVTFSTAIGRFYARAITAGSSGAACCTAFAPRPLTSLATRSALILTSIGFVLSMRDGLHELQILRATVHAHAEIDAHENSQATGDRRPATGDQRPAIVPGAAERGCR
ncbi:MAG: hypothetical protein ACYDCI_05465 [Candidatus Limnocylindrales bacterium]